MPCPYYDKITVGKRHIEWPLYHSSAAGIDDRHQTQKYVI